MLVKIDVRLEESNHAWCGKEAARRGLSLSAYIRTLTMREQERVEEAIRRRAVA